MDPISSESRLTPASVVRLVRAYFPANLSNKFEPICNGCESNRCENGQLFEHSEQLLAKMKHQFRMFGTPMELSEHLGVFKNSFLTNSFYEDDLLSRTFSLSWRFYNHTKTKSFITKLDVFFLTKLMCSEMFEIRAHVPSAMLACFFKAASTAITGNIEFFPYDGIVKFLTEQLERQFKTLLFGRTENPMIAPEKFEDCLEIFKKIVSKDGVAEDEFRVLEALLRKEFGDGCKENRDLMSKYMTIGSRAISIVRYIIFSNQFHVPNSKQSKGVSKGLTVLRLFVDGENKFVMDAEMELIEGGRSKPKPDSEPELTSSSEKVALEFIEKHPDVQLVITPIIRTPLRAVPFKDTVYNSYSILATDLVLETITDLLFGWKAFQGDQWDAVEALVEYLKEVVAFGHHEPYFENNDREDIIEKCKELFPIIEGAKSLKTSRNEQFCLDLKAQLIHLELDKTFPNIVELAKEYKLQKQCKKVSSVVAAIIKLVHVCFLEKFPIIAECIHNQKACRQILFCELCLETSSSSDTESEDEHLKEDVVKPLNKENIAPKSESIEKALRCNASESAEVQRQKAKAFWASGSKSKELQNKDVNSLSTQKSGSSSSSLDQVTSKLAQVALTRNEKTNKKPGPESTSPLAQKEDGANKKHLPDKVKPRILQRMPITDNSPASNVCEKCLRASNHSKKNAKKLQESKWKVKELEKKVKELEETLDERKVREREEMFETEIAKLKKKLKESKESEEKLKKENTDLRTESGRRRKNRESETNAYITNKEKLEQRLQESQLSLANAKCQISELQEELADLELRNASNLQEAKTQLTLVNGELLQHKKKLADVELQLRMSSETRLVYLKLKEIEVGLQLEKPMEVVEKKASSIIEHAREKKYKQGARYELEMYKKKFEAYQKELKNRIQVLENDPSTAASEFDPIPDLPTLSNMFLEAYEKVVKQIIKK